MDVGGCGGRVWDAPSPRIGCYRSASGGIGWWAHSPPTPPPIRGPPAPLRVAGTMQKLGMEFFFFFCEAPRPNRIRSADNFRVFFCQGCQGCPIGMKKAKTPQNRCHFFSRTKFFGKNAVITAIKHGNFSISWAERLAWLGKS